MKHKLFAAAGLFVILTSLCPAVNSVMLRHQTGSDFLKGKPENIIIDSSGTLRLTRQNRRLKLGGLLDDVWAINTMMADGQKVYLGTGPDAKVIRLSGDSAEQVYPIVADDASNETRPSIRNEHVFALAQDVAGRLLIGISGKSGKLVRVSGGNAETIYEDGRVQYIFAVTLDEDNNIYLATGPNGLLIRLDPFGANPQVIYDARDRSLLSLAVKDGIVYAGGDQRGLIYRIDPETRRATVLYDADQDEIPSLLIDENGDLYAAAASAGAAMLQLQSSTPSLSKAPGRPDADGDSSSSLAESVNTADSAENKQEKEETARPQQTPPPPAAKAAGHIYKVTPEGFVTDVFSEMAVLYSLTKADGKLWLGTGNKGELFTVDPVTEQAAVLYEDNISSQITSVLHVGDSAFVGLSNPARLMRIDAGLQKRGVFVSDFFDAGQPARWGKLQIEADIPAGSKVTMASRSGNVSDPNDQTFSPWSAETDLTEAAELNCPVARFCQYRLTLTASPDGATPVIRQVAAAHVVPNLPPRVVAVKAERSRDKKKPYAVDVTFAAADDNKDTLEYTLEFRKRGNIVWIPLKDKLDQTRFEWDSRTVEDGRYEVRVTASDYKNNTPDAALTGSRISDAFVIDNTAPEITDAAVAVEGSDVVLSLSIRDALSVLGKVQYTVDSGENWMTALPDDLVYDTLTETFTIRVKDLKPGRHVIAVMVADDPENTGYKTWEVDVP